MTAIQDHMGADLDPSTRARAERPVDFDAEQAECPACGASFATTATRCPDCGLNFG